MRKVLSMILLIFVISTVFGCDSESSSDGSTDFTAGNGGTVIRILSGSENKELESIINECAKDRDIKIEMTYKGSVDIMHELENGAEAYDAVWPSSSIWLSIGDKKHLVKHNESISLTPVVFGIRKDLAEKLGFIDKDVCVSDILKAINDKKMSFCMTSATQSNSGASAYIGFLYAFLGKQDGMTKEDLQGSNLSENITKLLSGVERSSGSSDFLKDLFLEKDYDAMVNYESLIINTNQKLLDEGKEALQIIYPKDGLTISDSPLGYVDHGDSKKETAFLDMQKYLLSDDIQKKIEATGRRIQVNSVSDENQSIFNSDWGIDTTKVLSPIQMPSAEVLKNALDMYQSNFKKPSLNIYCLDFSGSMAKSGQKELKEAMKQILVQEYAKKNMLQANDGEVNVVILFDDTILATYKADNNSDEALKSLYDKIANSIPHGGTDIYTAASTALSIAKGYDLSKYTPSIILMTDGQSQGYKNTFYDVYSQYGLDVPVFSITFGDADTTQLNELANKTSARVFDGSKDLTEAFRNVKGYN